MKVKRILIAIILVLVSYFSSNAVLDKMQDSKNIKDYGKTAAKSGKKQIVKNELLFLLVGVDKNDDGEEENAPTRTDTIMLVKANIETGKIDLLSIPRDSRILVRDEFTKANHAHAYGGIELTLQSLRNFLGLDIDYYVEVDFEGVEKIIDGIGGVDYKVPKGIYIDYKGKEIKPGENHFNGKKALFYLRTRNIFENGDLGRIDNQQKFLKAMVDELVKKNESLNLSTMVETYLKYVKTNIPLSIMMDFAKNISNFSSENMKTYTVPGDAQYIDEVSYYIPDYEKTWDIIREVYGDYRLKDWSKEDSGYMEYQGYYPENQDYQDNGAYQNQGAYQYEESIQNEGNQSTEENDYRHNETDEENNEYENYYEGSHESEIDLEESN